MWKGRKYQCQLLFGRRSIYIQSVKAIFASHECEIYSTRFRTGYIDALGGFD